MRTPILDGLRALPGFIAEARQALSALALLGADTFKAVRELNVIASDYLNAGHWCEAVVVGQRESGGFVWLAQSTRLREGEAAAIALDCMQAMHVNAVVAQGPCVLEDFYVGPVLMFHGGGRLVVHDCPVQPGAHIVVNLRGRLGA